MLSHQLAEIMEEAINKEVHFTRIFDETRKSKKLVIINVGGARSSKSHSIAQLMISKFLQEKGKRIGICRKTLPSLRMSTMLMVFDLLKEYGVYDEKYHNKTENKFDNGTNTIQFFGLDESEKIKSAEFNYIWMEEANEFTYEDYVALKLRLSGKTEPGELNHLYLSFNPIDENNWIAKRAVNETDTEVIRSTFEDNPTLSEAYIRMLKDLINQDENAYRVYVLGEWGVLTGLIFKNYTVIPELPRMETAKWAYGLDFGLVNPSVLVKVYLYDDKFYVEERLYRSGMTNADIIEFLSHEARGDIFGDPSAKQMLAEVRQAGYMAFDGHKGVKEGIDLCQRQKLYIPEASSHLLKEIRGYVWRKDRATGGFLPEPVKFNDHAVDAMRYAIYGMTERYGFATARPMPTEAISTLTFKGSTNNNKIIERWTRRKDAN